MPLFILMGEVASDSRLSAELFRAAQGDPVRLPRRACGRDAGGVGRLRRGFGSSLANAATMTRMALPELRKAGYDDGLSTGCIAAGGSTDILIPPSIILVIYAAIAELSVPKLLAAGLIPGLVLTLLYIAVALAVVRLRPHYAPADRELLLARAAHGADASRGSSWRCSSSPSAASMPASSARPRRRRSARFGAIVLGVIGRRLSMQELMRAIENSVVVSGLLFVIVIGANLFSFFMVQTHLPDLLLEGARAWALTGLTVMILIIVGYIVMGCFLEGIGMVLITVPVFQPVIMKFGYDPIWFAIIVVIMVEVGLIHPPVGMNLFVIQAQAPDVKITAIYRGIIPFLVAPLILIVLLFLFPGLALWLPKALYG